MLHATTITVLPDCIPCGKPHRGSRSALLGCVSVWDFLFLLVLTPATLKAQAPRYASYEVALELSRQIDACLAINTYATCQKTNRRRWGSI